MPGNFFDSNVLLYIASANAAKAARSEQLLARDGVVSVQVLNEIANVLRRKMNFSWNDTRAFLSLIRELVTVEPVTAKTHETGLALAERYRLSIYDAMIAAAALLAGCDMLWSEDMQDRLSIEGRTRVTNPFRASD